MAMPRQAACPAQAQAKTQQPCWHLATWDASSSPKSGGPVRLHILANVQRPPRPAKGQPHHTRGPIIHPRAFARSASRFEASHKPTKPNRLGLNSGARDEGAAAAEPASVDPREPARLVIAERPPALEGGGVSQRYRQPHGALRAGGSASTPALPGRRAPSMDSPWPMD